MSSVVLRRAAAPDAAAVADVWLRSYSAALPTVRRAHSDDEVRAHIRDVVVPRGTTWVAETTGESPAAVVGMMTLDGEEVNALYLAPGWRGRGIGDRFVALAKELSPTGLALWAFQVNHPAQRFYERHGFVEVNRTDGSGNEEREPDVRYAWRP
ncbi:GNAT family N-acetyltransferase [Streptomyces sp. F001]|uniref:GNAT family N-acetyltransferase n=1 Tax=Streptomyces sp. F001 TaxID=1510026 RepID=UPI00101E7B62|nr:GNAT family N-acetyltransferase [Streptomyces sp. F001]RZB20757.1 N-acetyltransferase [Streptomyces sp. F001]